MSETPIKERLEKFAAQNLFSLAGKRVLVTGASSGMGQALALGAAAAGGQVYALARRKERLEDLASAHNAITPVACDLSSSAARTEMISKVLDDGMIDVLINAAGTIAGVYPADEEPEDKIAETMEVNLYAPWHLCRAVAPAMRTAGKGSIVNIASISGIVGIGRIPQASYVASKTGLVGLTRELAAQWGRWGVRVNALAAGYFMSEMTADMFASPKMAEWVRVRQPMPFTGAPDDFVGTVLLLSSDAGRFITGQTYAVDGGWSAL